MREETRVQFTHNQGMPLVHLNCNGLEELEEEMIVPSQLMTHCFQDSVNIFRNKTPMQQVKEWNQKAARGEDAIPTPGIEILGRGVRLPATKHFLKPIQEADSKEKKSSSKNQREYEEVKVSWPNHLHYEDVVEYGVASPIKRELQSKTNRASARRSSERPLIITCRLE